MAENPKPKPEKTSNQIFLEDASSILDGTSKKSGLARLLPFLGPAFIASVAYVDPGNFATNIAGGAQFGYTLLWVIVAQQPDGDADPVALGQAGHRHRVQPGRAVPQSLPARGGVGDVGH